MSNANRMALLALTQERAFGQWACERYHVALNYLHGLIVIGAGEEAVTTAISAVRKIKEDNTFLYKTFTDAVRAN